MAIFKALTFDGVNSLDYGIYITGEAVYNAPERAVEMVNIPGKNGALALDQGRFENIEVTYHAGCFADSQADFADKVMKFRNALASRYTYKRLTDEYHPDEYRLGLYKSGLDVDAVRYGTAGEFNIVFDCKPQRFLVDGDREILPTEWTDVQTATGELVTIDSDGSLAVKSLEVSLSPIQDLNGYDKPWVGGAGVNLFPYLNARTATFNGVTFFCDGKGTLTMQGTATTNDYTTLTFPQAFVIPDGADYKFCMLNDEAHADSVFRFVNGSTIVDSWSPNPANREATYVGMSGKTVTGIRLYCAQGETYNLTMKPMFVPKSTTVTGYIPYSNICPISGHTEVDVVVSPTTDAEDGNTYTTALGRTVYGGTLDVVSGKLTVDRAMVTLNGSEPWTASNGTATACMRVETNSNIGFKPNTSNASLVGDISSAFIEVTPRQTWDGTVGFSVSTDANPYLHFCQTGQKNMSVEAWKTYLASNPIQVVGLLATPQTYQLTPQQIDLLLGTNHLWSDGEITVEYGVHPYYNPTPFASKPLIKVTGRGTLGIGEYILTITGTASQTLYIDCDTMEIYTIEGTVPTGASSLVSINRNDFPVLEPGTNYISVGSGITNVEIVPRWWRI